MTVVEYVEAEMRRAHQRFGEGSMRGSRMTRAERLAVLVEEVGEVGREVVTELRNASDREPDRHGRFQASALASELIQVAACALMWAEAEGFGE